MHSIRLARGGVNGLVDCPDNGQEEKRFVTPLVLQLLAECSQSGFAVFSLYACSWGRVMLHSEPSPGASVYQGNTPSMGGGIVCFKRSASAV